MLSLYFLIIRLPLCKSIYYYHSAEHNSARHTKIEMLVGNGKCFFPKYINAKFCWKYVIVE